MSFADYTALQAAVLDFNWARDTSAVADAITLAHTKINLGLRVPFMQKTADLTIDSYRIAAPSDFAAVGRLWIDGAYDNPLSPTSPDMLANLRANYSASQPLWYAIEGESDDLEYFVFGPDPGTTSYTGKLLYTRRLPFFADGTATNIVLTRYPNLYLYGALAELANYNAGDSDLASYVPQFYALMEQINAQARSDAYAGSAMQMQVPYGVP